MISIGGIKLFIMIDDSEYYWKSLGLLKL